MLIAPNPSTLLRKARKQLGLTQAELSELTDVNRRRISAFECGDRLPTPEEQDALCAALELPRDEMALAVPSGTKPCFPEARKRFAPHARFQVPRDRSSVVRLQAAKKQFPGQVQTLANRLRARPDLRWVSLYLRDACFDSGLEFLASMTLLAEGALPGWLSPQNSGFTKLPIINPADREVSGHHPYPALLWEERLLFPQVTVTNRGSLIRMDFLMGVPGRGETRWWDVEIDGIGHNPAMDSYRNGDLGLPVQRFDTDEVASGRFLDSLRTLS